MNRIMRSGNYHEKEYVVTVDREVTNDFIRKMAKGVPILDTVTRPCTVSKDRIQKFPYYSYTGTEPADPQDVPIFWI